MDERDFRLLAHWFERPFASLEELGRVLGLSGAAVKARVGALQSEGVLQQFWTVPAASLFGLWPRVYLFEVEMNPAAAIDVALRDDSVVWAKAYENLAFERRLPGTLAVLCYLSNPGKVPDRLREAFGAPSFVRTPGWPTATAGPNPIISPLDWRILRAMVKNPRAPPATLGESAGLTEKTARRRRTRLMMQGFVGVQPLVNGGHARGIACFHLVIYTEHGASVPDLSRWVRGVVIESIPEPSGSVIVCWAPSVAEVVALEPRLLSLPEVRIALLSSPILGELATRRLLKWIDSQLSAWDRNGRSPAERRESP